MSSHTDNIGTGTATTDRVVSSDSEELILVDAADSEVGHLNKAACHDGEGILHRAFSVFLFNAAGELLLQQRAAGKRLWPEYWSNSCCSHPRKGESMDEATSRRMQQELGTSAPVEFIYKFSYQAQYDDSGAENELCWVYLGRVGESLRPNGNEIAAIRFVDRDTLNDELARNEAAFTPWFKLEWQRLQEEFASTLSRYAAAA